MNMHDVVKYINANRKFEMPNFQEDLLLSYSETNKVLEQLTKGGVIEYCGGFEYKAIKGIKEEKVHTVYKPKNEEEKFLIDALGVCVKCGVASVTVIQRRLCCGYVKATQALEWMEEKGYVGPYPERELRIGSGEYYEKFGNPNNESNKVDRCRLDRVATDRQQTLIERVMRIDGADDDDFECCDDDNDDEEEVDDDEKKEQKYLERRRELMTRLRRLYNEPQDSDDGQDEGGKDNGAVDLKHSIIESLERRLTSDSSGEKCVLHLEGETRIELHYSCGTRLEISDGGETLLHVMHSKRKIRNMLKRFPHVVLVDDEISITVEDTSDALNAILVLYAAIDAVKNIKRANA